MNGRPAARVVVIIAGLFGLLLWAAHARGQVVFPLVVERPNTYLTDTAGTLSQTEAAGLETFLREYEKRTTNEVAVVIVPTLAGTTVEDYANRLFHSWGIGKKAKDNGVLMLWSTGDRKVRIEVGYGLEQALPDGRAGQIIRDNILPAFKAGRWYDGVRGGITAIIVQLDAQALGGNTAPARPDAPSDYTGVWVFLAVLLGGGLLTGGLVWAYVWFSREVVAILDAHPYTPPEVYTQPVYVPQPRQAYVPAVPETDEELRRKKRAREEEYERQQKRHREEDEESSRRSSYSHSSYDPSPSPSYSPSDSGSSFGGFGGGDSGGGGASGSY